MAPPTLQYAISYTAMFVAAYWAIFTVGYYSPWAPRNGAKKGNKSNMPSQRVAFANRWCSFSHAITDTIVCAYIMYKYQKISDVSGRMFLPITYDQPSDEDFHWVIPVLLGYCVGDSIFMAIFEKDFLMTMHHVAVVIGVMPLYLAPYGWYMCIVSTFFAEITNPLQNTWQYTREYGPRSWYEALSFPFTVAFFVCRGLLMPIFLLDFFMFIWMEKRPNDDEATQMQLKISWVIFTMGWFASLIWLKGVVGGYLRYLKKKRAADKGKMQ
uniref:TLC domain-containing protein n=1 Tax=Pyramimonas obovata TaxID=1411642 RepID=A0A7S0WTB8_9CHLO|mmetsp:Transcript_38830/g.84521  ORF Transcript_38830/g.84521 Transcript_38830/m.84521 type:complete len:269 (+) Transcript_38830:310-1116(+)|eukprot:CAMPEP_0118936944 /NCGR_PEP_ID=MMETSP1169-20130426/21176_1 /TAXON_ID=36882 /ORGANISM="Pyramimonas obovata, Strain CCMP722" /LENGTH=268 /DNA_ID=CAMNT_0006880419 /DNA_START=243 /DNA_END=1049 /DNA_ORIENTATION=+